MYPKDNNISLKLALYFKQNTHTLRNDVCKVTVIENKRKNLKVVYYIPPDPGALERLESLNELRHKYIAIYIRRMKMVTYRPDVALPLKKEYNKTNKRNDVSPNPATTCVYFKIYSMTGRSSFLTFNSQRK